MIVSPLQVPPNSYAQYTVKIDAAGQVPGSAFLSGNPGVIPIVWNRDGSFREVPTPFQYSQAYVMDIEPGGNAVGSVRFGGDYPLPVNWSTAGEVSMLPLPQQFGAALVTSGSITVGAAYYPLEPLPNGSPTTRIAVWQDQELLTIHDLPNGYGGVFDINSHGQYVGKFGSDAGAFTGQGTTFELLEWDGVPIVEAVGINDAGTIIGALSRDGHQTFSSYVAHGDKLEELAGLPGFATCAVSGLNNSETIVGICWNSLGDEAAVVYLNGDRTPIDMNTLIDPIPGVKLVRGIDVNDAGQILVEGQGVNGYSYYILSPIPEPAMAMLLGLVGLAMRRRGSR